VFLGIWGARNALRNEGARIVWLSYVSLAVVGIGSAAFHTSLKYEGQLGSGPTDLFIMSHTDLYLNSGPNIHALCHGNNPL
jgi:hypothetical protein